MEALKDLLERITALRDPLRLNHLRSWDLRRVRGHRVHDAAVGEYLANTTIRHPARRRHALSHYALHWLRRLLRLLRTWSWLRSRDAWRWLRRRDLRALHLRYLRSQRARLLSRDR